MSFVRHSTGYKPQLIDVTRQPGYSNPQLSNHSPDHLADIIDDQLHHLVEKNKLHSVKELLDKYGEAVSDVIEQYCKHPNTKIAFEKVISRYRDKENTNSQSQVCFNPLITSAIAYVDKESLSTANQKTAKASSIKSLA